MPRSKKETKENLTSTDTQTPEGYDKDFFTDLIKQVQAEYLIAWDNQKSKISKRLLQLKLYNNQKRDPNATGDPLIFTIMNTLHAALYDDRLMSVFEGWEEGDEETAENLNGAAEYDYDLMQKDIIDYFWIWDTLFTSRGLVRMYEFNRDKRYMCPVPENVDSITFLRDPDAKCVNGIGVNKIGKMRFGGREINIPKWKLQSKYGFFNVDSGLKLSVDIKSLLKEAQDARDEAFGRDQLKDASDETLGDNGNVPVLEWRTIYKGKQCIVYLANGKTRPIKYIDLGDPETEDWDLIDRALNPTSQDWDGVSVPDLAEDKQRMRSVMINLGIQSVKADLYPMYLYDESRIKNKGDLMNFGFNKFVAIQGDGDVRGAAQPLNKAAPRMDFVSFILDTLDVSAQRATATPDMQQGQISNQQRTLGELNLVASKVDTRYSLSAKVFGWSDKQFWLRWYYMYKKHMQEKIDEKVIRINGSYGNRWRKLLKDNMIMQNDPDIRVESKAVSESKAMRDSMRLNSYGALVLKDPTANKLFFMRKLAKLNGLDRNDIMRLYPPTPDEQIAEQENGLLSDDKLVQVGINDDDLSHMEIHAKAAETKAKSAHLQAHLDNMMIKRSQPELFQKGQVNQGEALMPQNAGVDTGNPVGGMGNATPSGAVTPPMMG